jgi:hypothetical protein
MTSGSRLALLISLFALGFGGFPARSETEIDWFNAMSCPVSDQLDRAYAAYTEHSTSREISALVSLDAYLRSVLAGPTPYGVPLWPAVCAKPKYLSFGFYVEHFCQCAIYDGKILRDAHAIDPDSEHRSATLYSTVERGSHNAAGRYLSAFPHGPFAPHAHRILGGFYSDLFQLTRDELAGRERDYKWDCYATELDGRSLGQQKQEFQSRGIEHFLKALARDPEHRKTKIWLRELQAGTIDEWHGCHD